MDEMKIMEEMKTEEIMDETETEMVEIIPQNQIFQMKSLTKEKMEIMEPMVILHETDERRLQLP